MVPTWVWVLIAVVLVVIVAGYLIAAYNGLVRLRNLVQESWRQVDVELQRRHDLIPNLIETVKGYAAHERGVLVSVIDARNRAVAVRQAPGSGPAEQGQAESFLQAALGRLFALAEAYPDLKANQNFLALQGQLAETEDRVAAGRRYYNANVRTLNTKVESFPSNIVAGMFRFAREQYFEVTDQETRAVPAVDFSGVGGSGAGQGSAVSQSRPDFPPEI
ncbi:MAG: LemA family protein [Acidimicrobiales bacterium]|nr:MAG: LemA family protein [Acidimicrobiales bacterium]